MGNCITSSKATLAAEDYDHQNKAAEQLEKTSSSGRSRSTSQAVKGNYDRKNGKRVRFALRQEDGNRPGGDLSETKSGAIRIRLVLTQKELHQILNGENKRSSTGKLLKAIKKRCHDGERERNWKPALESIPEDY